MSINIDFQIYDSKDPKYIIVLDTSNWAHIKDKPSIIEVIPPGFTEPWVEYFNKNEVNYISSSTTGLSCFDCGDNLIDLPDGIYEITVKGSPEKFQCSRYYLKTTKIENELDDRLLEAYSECKSCSENNDDIEKVLRYKNLIEVANAAVRKGDKCTAQGVLDNVQKYLSSFKKCRKCPHNQ